MDKIMESNIKLLTYDSKFNKDYYRNKYVEAINKIATMTGEIVDLQQQLLLHKEINDQLNKSEVSNILELQAKLIKNQSRLEWLIEENTALRKTVKRLKGLKIKE